MTIGLGKEKYQTTVKEKSSDRVEWGEQCELSVTVQIRNSLSSYIFRPIPLHGNVVDINLTVLHRNFLGVDEFLGQISLPLKEFDVYERPKSRWLPLRCKPGQNKSDYRGEIEARWGIRTISHLTFWVLQVKIGFTVKATNNLGGSAVDLSKKKKGSITSLHKVIFPGC